MPEELRRDTHVPMGRGLESFNMANLMQAQ